MWITSIQMDQQLIVQVMTALDATPQRLRQIQNLPTYEAARKALEEVKAEARKRYQKLVFEWHPDRHPEAVEEMTMKLKTLNRVFADLDQLKLQPRPPRPVMQVVHFYPRTSPFGGTATTTNTSYTAWHPTSNSSTAGTRTYNARRAVFIRFG